MTVVETRLNSYPLQLALTYVAQDHSGKARTERISSETVSLSIAADLGIGTAIQLTIDWPAPDKRQPLQLVVNGRILHAVGQMKTVEIIRHEFRNRLLSQTYVAGAWNSRGTATG